jgi:hypothetical protein
MTSTNESSPSIDRRALVRDAIRFSSLIGAGICAVVTILGLPDLAIAIAVGTLLGAVNFVLLARGVGGAIDRTVAGVERTKRELGVSEGAEIEPNDVLGRPLGAGGGLRLALLVLLVAALVWLLPTDPAGLAMGIIITLVGASVAALRSQLTNPPKAP